MPVPYLITEREYCDSVYAPNGKPIDAERILEHQLRILEYHGIMARNLASPYYAALPKEGLFIFIPQMRRFSLDDLMGRVDVDGVPGKNNLARNRFYYEIARRPNAPAYMLLDVDDGEELPVVDATEARTKLRERKRRAFSIQHGTFFAMYFPWIFHSLKTRCLAGSEHKGESPVLDIDFSSGAPRLAPRASPRSLHIAPSYKETLVRYLQ